MTAQGSLKRDLGVPSAVLLGLGSIVGTGVFLSLGLATQVAQSLMLPALLVAALLALLNGLSSAQLAAAHPVSGGTYSYGARYLSPLHGFAAGWMFLCAKSASAATAALTLAGAIGPFIGLGTLDASNPILPGFAMVVVWGISLSALGGIKKTARHNAAIVGFTLVSLFVFVGACLASAASELESPKLALERLSWFSVESPIQAALHSCALLFVAFTGYGRIATLGEEVRNPRRTIPIAIFVSTACVLLLYALVALAAMLAVGPSRFGELATETNAPLPAIAEAIGKPLISRWVSLGAVTALVSVILNLILGLSRVMLAMGRSGDLPALLAKIRSHVPRAAVIGSSLMITLLVLIGNVRTTWSFSAFTVLIYYGITHWAALALPEEHRMYPRWTAWVGLAGCLFLAFQVPAPVWISGCGILAAGVGVRAAYRWIA